MSIFSRFLFTITGALIMWMFKGFKGPLNHEKFYLEERNSKMAFFQLGLGVGIWLVVIASGIWMIRVFK